MPSSHDPFYLVIDQELNTRLADNSSSSLMSRVKRLAKYFSQSAAQLTHAAALNGVSRACGQQDWFHLQQAAKSLNGTQNWQSAFPIIRGAEALMLELPQAEAPDQWEVQTLEAFGARLAMELGVGKTLSLDVIARSHGAATWGSLIARERLMTSGPLYSFRPTGFGDWKFVPTELGEQLEDELDGIEGTAWGTERSLSRAHSMVAARPGFFPAWKYIGDRLLDERQYAEAGEAYKTGIAYAESLFPRHFKGVLSRGLHGVHAYYCLLRGSITVSDQCCLTKESIRLTRKLLRVNPTDNMGVRYLLPCLYAGDDDNIRAERALRRIGGKDTGAQHALAIALVKLEHDTFNQEGLEYLLTALFKAPYLRQLLLRVPLPDLHERGSRWVRGVIYDLQGMVDMVEAAMPDYIDRDYLFQSVLGNRKVKAAEKRLEAMYFAEPTDSTYARSDAFDAFHKALKAEAKATAASLRSKAE